MGGGQPTQHSLTLSSTTNTHFLLQSHHLLGHLNQHGWKGRDRIRILDVIARYCTRARSNCFAGWIQSGGAWITHICFVLALKWSFSVVSDSLIRGFITLDRKAYLSITTDLSLLDCLV